MLYAARLSTVAIALGLAGLVGSMLAARSGVARDMADAGLAIAWCVWVAGSIGLAACLVLSLFRR